jgi:hypothetical protein
LREFYFDEFLFSFGGGKWEGRIIIIIKKKERERISSQSICE